MLEIWNEAAPAARIGILLLATLCVVALGGVGYWSSQPSYVTLISEADIDKVDRVMDALDKANIKYELSGAGGNLRVAKTDFSKARMLARGAGASTVDGADLGMGSTFASPADRKRTATRKQEQRLAKTIEQMKVIDNADVHLSLPEKGPFERRTSLPTASVMLTLNPGERLTDQQASSIASMVAFAVPDLEPEAVQISDKDGRSYTMPEEGMQQIASQIEYTTGKERSLARKAEAQLNNFLGYGNASVQVTLDLTFTNGSTKTTKYNPDGKVPSEEDLVTETTNSSNPNQAGAAGVASNLAGNRGAQGGSKSIDSKTEKINTKYKVSTTEETQSNTTPVRNFMSVSVIVNSDAESLTTADGAAIPDIEATVQSIVENAVGLRQGTDSISVKLLSFPKPEALEEVEVPYDWSQWTELVRNASLAIAAIVAFLIGFLMLRKIKPVPASAEPIQLGDEQSESIKQISDLMRNNPEALGQMLAAWAGDEADSGDQSTRRAA